MPRVANLVRFFTPTVGTGATITIGSPVPGFISPSSAGMVTGGLYSYAVEDGLNREVGVALYDQATNQLTRYVRNSTNSNNPIALSVTSQVIITPLAEDISLYDTKTFQIPTDFPTLQEAIAQLSTIPVSANQQIILNIASGHQPAVGLLLSNGSFGHFKITSTDPVVSVHSSFTGPLFYGWNCRMPLIACLFDMLNRGTHGYTINGSQGVFEPGAGAMNSGQVGCEARSSHVYAASTIWTGSGYEAIRMNNGAHATFQSADVSNSNWKDDPNAGDFGRAIYCSRASVLTFAQGTCIGSGGNGIVARRSLVNAHEATITGSGLRNVISEQGATVALQFANVSGAGVEDLRVFDGGIIAAYGATYTTKSQAENIVTGAGILFNGGATFGTTQSGSNANGQYVRYPDGTQICSHHLKLLFVDAARMAETWTFPVPFIDGAAKVVTATIAERSPANVIEGISSPKRALSVVEIGAHSLTTANVAVRTSASNYLAGDFVWANVIAIGRYLA